MALMSSVPFKIRVYLVYPVYTLVLIITVSYVMPYLGAANNLQGVVTFNALVEPSAIGIKLF